MGEVTKINQSLPAQQEADNISRAAQEDAGFEKLLKYKKGTYYCDNEVVPIGTQYTAHCVGWVKGWVKFINQQVVERKMYPVVAGLRPPEREELDDLDRNKWPNGPNGQPSDPWVYQYLLPMEDRAGDLVVFVTSSFGGKRAVADLCKSYSRRVTRTGTSQMPVVEIHSGVMKTQAYGDVPRPVFEVVGWDTEKEGIREVRQDTLKEEMHDDIPF